MKKTKLIILLSSIATATPIIATSCSSSSDTIQINAVGLNNKVALGGKICATLSLSVNNETQTIANANAFSSIQGLSVMCTAKKKDNKYNYYADLTISATGADLEIGDQATITYTLTDVYNRSVTKTLNVTVVNNDYQVSDIETFNNVSYGNSAPKFEAWYYVTNANNWVDKSTVDFDNATNFEIYDEDEIDVTDQFTIQSFGPTSTQTNSPFYFTVVPTTAAEGEYTLDFNLNTTETIPTHITDQSFKFKVVNGFNVVQDTNTTWDSANTTLYVNSVNEDASATFTIANLESPYTEEDVTYSFKSTPIWGIKIDQDSGNVTISKEIAPNVSQQVTIVATIYNNFKLELPITIQSR